MGTYNSAILTTAGQSLIANAINGGGTVEFTSVKTSSHAYPEGTNIPGLTELQNVRQTVEPFSAQVFNDTLIQVSSRFDNSNVSEAYLVENLGIYAQLGDNEEILFAVVQAVTPDQMPSSSTVSPSAFIYNVQITIQQASSLTVTVNPAGTATVQDILDLQALVDKKVNISGGDVANTKVSTITESTASFPTPASNDSLKTLWGKVKKWQQDCMAKFGNYVLMSMITNQQVNSTNNIPTSALVYLMQQAITANSNSIAQLNSDKAARGTVDFSDIDTISESGLYRTLGTPGTLIHIRYDVNYAFQLLHAYVGNLVKFRFSQMNVWGEWNILSPKNVQSIAISDWFTLHKSSNIVIARVNTVRTSGIAKDTKYTLNETIPVDYRPIGITKFPVRIRASNYLSPYGDGVVEFYPDGTIMLYASQDIPNSQFEIDGCGSWITS